MYDDIIIMYGSCGGGKQRPHRVCYEYLFFILTTKMGLINVAVVT